MGIKLQNDSQLVLTMLDPSLKTGISFSGIFFNLVDFCHMSNWEQADKCLHNIWAKKETEMN